MREFFKGWKRKAGVVTVVMALAIFAIWCRSDFTIYALSFGRKSHCSLEVGRGELRLGQLRQIRFDTQTQVTSEDHLGPERGWIWQTPRFSAFA